MTKPRNPANWILVLSALVETLIARPAKGGCAPQLDQPMPQLGFVENIGQFSGDVLYRYSAGGVTWEFLSQGLRAYLAPPKAGHDVLPYSSTTLLFCTPSGESQVSPGHELEGRVNYLRGSEPCDWYSGVRRWERLHYRNVWPGIDVVFHTSTQGRLEYDIALSSNADLSAFRVRCEGAAMTLFDAGERLVLSTQYGELEQAIPAATVSTSAGPREQFVARFVLAGQDTFGLMADRDLAGTISIVDPTFTYSTYIGGVADDNATAVSTDSSGALYIAGQTKSPDLLSTTGVALTGSRDIFVLKLKPHGGPGSIVYATIINVDDQDRVAAIAIDSSGNAYLTGTTYGGFPIVLPSLYPTYSGNSDAFLLKLNSNGQQILFSTYLGGHTNNNQWNGTDDGKALFVDPSGLAVYVVGATSSYDFPTTTCAYWNGITGQGGGDGFVSAVLTNGTVLLYSTCFALVTSGASQEECYGVAASDQSHVYVAAHESTGLPGSVQAVVARIDTLACGNNSLVWSTYLSGSGDEYPSALCLDPNGDIFVAGQTNSPDFALPATLNGYDPSYNGGWDVFLAKLTSSGTLHYATYFGGPNDDIAGTVMHADASGVYLTGRTNSTTLPVTFGAQRSASIGAPDAFLVRIEPNGNGAADLAYSSYVGGSGSDAGVGVVVHPDYQIPYVVGTTASSDFGSTSGAVQAGSGGGNDVFASGFAIPYCTSTANSSGQPALISFVGIPDRTQNLLTLVATQCPPYKSGIFFYGSNQTQVPFGAGYLCTTPPRRLSLVTTNGFGQASYGVPVTTLFAMPGTWNFQFWYRDPLSLGPTTNLSNAVAIHF